MVCEQGPRKHQRRAPSQEPGVEAHLVDLADAVHASDGLDLETRVQERLDEEDLRESERVSETRGTGFTAGKHTKRAQVKLSPADCDLVCCDAKLWSASG